LPPPGRQTLDIGCGEGRLARDLKELGHRIVRIDSSPSLVAAALEFDPSMDLGLADAAARPLDGACADLVVAFMSLQDIDGMPTAIREAARVLESSGRLCLAIVHPINSAGSFEEATADEHFVIKCGVQLRHPCAATGSRLRTPHNKMIDSRIFAVNRRFDHVRQPICLPQRLCRNRPVTGP
jgi:SAM-dependent methyltransferase